MLIFVTRCSMVGRRPRRRARARADRNGWPAGDRRQRYRVFHSARAEVAADGLSTEPPSAEGGCRASGRLGSAGAGSVRRREHGWGTQPGCGTGRRAIPGRAAHQPREALGLARPPWCGAADCDKGPAGYSSPMAPTEAAVRAATPSLPVSSPTAPLALAFGPRSCGDVRGRSRGACAALAAPGRRGAPGRSVPGRHWRRLTAATSRRRNRPAVIEVRATGHTASTEAARRCSSRCCCIDESYGCECISWILCMPF